MSKVFGSELAQDVAAWLVDLFGAPAQVPDAADALVADAELFQRTSTVLTIIGGTSEVQRNIVATQGLGLPRGS
jgi:alkylation response protein AidB-like acyl-CoA dehydrogenase